MNKFKVILVVLLAFFLISCQAKEQLFSVEFEFNGADVALEDYKNIELGSEIILPNITREHYEFLGWYSLINGEKVYLGNRIIVSENMTLYADWKPNVYVVTFYHDSRIISRQNVEYLESAFSPIPPFKEGYYFVGWDKAFTHVSGHLNVYALFNINIYTVRYFDKDLQMIKEETVQHLGTSTPPEVPTYEGYVFTGWSKSSTQITQNTDIYATYALGQYLVEFKNEDNQIISIQTPYHGDDLIEPTPPAKIGYTFIGWSQSLENVQQSMVIYPQYEKNSYIVTFYNENGDVIHTTSVDYLDNVTDIPDLPTKEGYHSVGWNHSLTSIQENTSVYPVYYIKSFYVNFRSHLGLAFDIQLIEYGKAATVPSIIPAPVGYHFIGWSRSFNEITQNIDVFAQYEINTYDVIFKDLEENVLFETTINHGETAFAPVPPSIEGKNHIGWTSDITNITSNRVIYPVYEWKTYNITFRQDNEVIIEVVTVQHGMDAIMTQIPTKEGHIFIEWNQSLLNITTSFDVYPVYQKMLYDVVFYDGEGNVLEEMSVLYMNPALPTLTPTKVGHTFIGWQQDISHITSNLNVYPHFEPKIYLVNYYDETGHILLSQEVAFGTSPEVPITPTHATLYFVGWYIDLGLTIPYTFTPMPAYNISIFSKWLVTSSISPEITGYPESVTLEYGESFNPLLGVTATDIPDGDLTDLIQVSGWDESYSQTPGEYEVTLSVEDSHGNITSVSFWVTVGELMYSLNATYQTYVSNVSNLNPHTETLTGATELYTLISDYLYRGDYDWAKAIELGLATQVGDFTNTANLPFTYVPSMAVGLPIDVNGDGMVWEISLRNDLTFIDGTSINAYTFDYSYRQLLDPLLSNSRRIYFIYNDYLPLINAEYYAYQIEPTTWEEVGFEVVDTLTMRFHLNAKKSQWQVMSNLATAITSVVHPNNYENGKYDEGTRTNYGTIFNPLVSFGRYQLIEWEADTYFKLQRDDSHYDAAAYKIKFIQYSVINDLVAAIDLYEQGQLDYVSVGGSYYQTYKNSPYLKLTPLTTFFRLAFSIDRMNDGDPANDNPIMQYLDLRRALYFGTDRETFTRDVRAPGFPTHGILGPAYYSSEQNLYSYRTSIPGQSVLADLAPDTYGYDPILAKQLFDAAYAQAVADGVINNGDVVSVEFVFADTETNHTMANWLEATWENIFGPKFNLVKSGVPSAQLTASGTGIWSTGNYDITYGGWQGLQYNAPGMLQVYSSDRGVAYMLEKGFETGNIMLEVELGAGKQAVQGWLSDLLMISNPTLSEQNLIGLFQNFLSDFNGNIYTNTYDYIWEIVYYQILQYDQYVGREDDFDRITAALESALLGQMINVPLFTSVGAAVYSARVQFDAQAFNARMGWGGYRYMYLVD